MTEFAVVIAVSHGYLHPMYIHLLKQNIYYEEQVFLGQDGGSGDS